MPRKKGLKASPSSIVPSAQGDSSVGGGDQFQAQHICLSHRWQLPQWGASFFLLPKQKQGETSEDQSLRDATGPAWKPHHLWLRRAYRLGRSCRSFFTQGVSGFTQTLSRLFSLILENREELEQPSPPVLLTKGGTEIIQGGWGEQRACTHPPPQEALTPPRGAGSCSPPAGPRCCCISTVG